MREPHGFSSSLSYCPDSKIPLQGAAWGGPPAGAGDHPAGLQRTGREDHPWRSVTRSCAYDHVHMFVEIPPHIAVSDFVRRAKGRSSRKIQQEFEHIRKRYWGQRFWQRGYFSTTSGNITDDVILNYLDKHTNPNKAGFSPNP